jgi:hypothetical protein
MNRTCGLWFIQNRFWADIINSLEPSCCKCVVSTCEGKPTFAVLFLEKQRIRGRDQKRTLHRDDKTQERKALIFG